MLYTHTYYVPTYLLGIIKNIESVFIFASLWNDLDTDNLV